VNFLPEDYLEMKFRRRAAVICATLLGVVIGGTTVVGVAFRVSIKELQDQRRASQRKCAMEYGTIRNLENLRDQQQALARQAEVTASLLEKQVPRSSIISDVGRALPVEVVLTELTLEPTGQADSPDETIRIRGQAKADVLVADLIVQLKRSRLFFNVHRLAADAVGDDRKTTVFDLQMSLNSPNSASIDLPQAHSETVSLNPE
jgi:Tfp pilus assembly protein PilN